MESVSSRKRIDGARDWSGLRGDLVRLILGKVKHASDYLRFRAVCKPWRLAALEAKPQSFMPLLIAIDASDGQELYIYDFADHKVRTVELWREDDPISQYHLVAATRGWLVFWEYSHRQRFVLMNPLSGFRIKLPPVLESGSSEIYCVVASCNPMDPNCTVVASIGRWTGVTMTYQMAFCKLSENAWNIINVDYSFDKIICQDSNFYAFDGDEEVLVQGRFDNNRVEIKQVSKLGELNRSLSVVELSGDLSLIRLCNGLLHVSKMNLNTWKWEQASRCLKGNSLLRSWSKDIVVSARQFPEIRPNCLYYEANAREVRVYDLQSGIDETVIEFPSDSYLGHHWVLPDISQAPMCDTRE